MNRDITIAIDAMGGDQGVVVTVPASFDMLYKYKNLRLILVGDEKLIRKQIDSYKKYELDSNRFKVHHTSQQIEMDESPSKALRNKKDSSMRVAINLVKDGTAQACISAGNTGALMATAKFVLKTLPGINRPAIITSFPTRDETKSVRMLDLGANVDSSSENLYQFAVMGSVLTSAISGIPAPKIGLLNIGSEETKGNDKIKHTAQLLIENKNINYIGYLEGDDILNNVADVVVCDGFVGNVALKAMEGMVNLVGFCIKRELKKNWYTRLISIFTLPVLRGFKKKLDPGRHNGASLVGLCGIVVKSHGGANRNSFTSAINEAILQVEKNVPKLIKDQVKSILEGDNSK